MDVERLLEVTIDLLVACESFVERLWLATDHSDWVEYSLADWLLKLVKASDTLSLLWLAWSMLVSDLLISALWLASEADRLLRLVVESDANDCEAVDKALISALVRALRLASCVD